MRPLKSAVTVPKLELSAATLAVKINRVVMKELEGRMKFDTVTYWTDSMIVCKYIANDVRRFVTSEKSEPSQWRHIQSELNPADYASRGIKPPEAEKLDRWSRGPEFLWKDVAEWPTQPPEVLDDLLDNDEGVKKTTSVGATTVRADFWDRLFYTYTTWKRLRRVVAWLLRVIHTPVESGPQLKRNRISGLRPEP